MEPVDSLPHSQEPTTCLCLVRQINPVHALGYYVLDVVVLFH